ncbi:MAG: 6-phosphogluconolactonase [Patiriisocius sp.]|jgi:6-phosphogluconolactonase
MTKPPMLVGTYTRDTDSEGIYRAVEGKSSELVARCDNPSFLAKRPQGDVIYAVSEVDDYQSTNSGAVIAFFAQLNGQLTEMNQESSEGADPCHLTVSAKGSYLVVSNYSGGTLTSIQLDGEGHLEQFISLTQHTGHSIDPDRQEAAHIHSSLLVEGESALLVADLGADQLIKYEISSVGQISTEGHRVTAPITAGAGPRLMTVRQNDVYLLNELNNTVTVHNLLDLSLKQSIGTLGSGDAIDNALDNGSDISSDSIAAHIELSKDGRFLYTSNRGDDSISIFSLEGGLRLIDTVASGGKHPRYFALSPDQSKLYVANMLSDQISCFDRDAESGRLADSSTRIDVPAPTCLLFA